MGFAGNTSVPIDEATAKKNYDFLRSTQLYFWLQKGITAPKAVQYCANLFLEAPQAKESVEGKLAVVTGVTVGGAGYHVAEELALSAGMSVIIMGRNSNKLIKAEEAIQAEAKKRGVAEPKLYHAQYDLDDLSTAISAAKQVEDIAKKEYSGQLHVLVNNAGASVPDYKLTKQGAEANTGRNFLAPHLLTEKLIPLLKAAATPTYKPRCVFVASLGYCLTLDYDPQRMLEKPAEGGAPEGALTFDGDGKCTSDMLALIYNYGRAKLADVASAHYLAKKEPSINFTSLQPGSIASNFGNSLGLAAKIYYYGFYIFQFTPSQGARAALRAALDPEFDTEAALQGAYLHADGNPWPKDQLKIEDPDTKQPYEWDKYSEKVVTLANDLIAKLLPK